MSNIDSIKGLEFIMPVILLLLGSLLTVHRMKKNIKLGAKLKWKEEFRNKTIDFIRESMELHNKSVFLNLTPSDNDLEKNKVTGNFVDISQKFDAAFYAIDLMIKDENDDTRFLIIKYREIKDEAFNEFENESGSTDSSTINEFYQLAKSIYNNEDYLNKII